MFAALCVVFLSHTKFFVLDECDSLCDPRNGFTDIIEKYIDILNQKTSNTQKANSMQSAFQVRHSSFPISPPRQFVFVSASVNNLLSRFIKNRVQAVKQCTADTLHYLPSNLNISYVHIGTKDKIQVLVSTLQNEFTQYQQQQQVANHTHATNNSTYKQPHIMIFCNTIDSVRAVDYALHAAQIKCCSLHGQMPSKVSQLFIVLIKYVRLFDLYAN